MGIAKQ